MSKRVPYHEEKETSDGIKITVDVNNKGERKITIDDPRKILNIDKKMDDTDFLNLPGATGLDFQRNGDVKNKYGIRLYGFVVNKIWEDKDGATHDDQRVYVEGSYFDALIEQCHRAMPRNITPRGRVLRMKRVIEHIKYLCRENDATELYQKKIDELEHHFIADWELYIQEKEGGDRSPLTIFDREQLRLLYNELKNGAYIGATDEDVFVNILSGDYNGDKKIRWIKPKSLAMYLFSGRISGPGEKQVGEAVLLKFSIPRINKIILPKGKPFDSNDTPKNGSHEIDTIVKNVKSRKLSDPSPKH